MKVRNIRKDYITGEDTFLVKTDNHPQIMPQTLRVALRETT